MYLELVGTCLLQLLYLIENICNTGNALNGINFINKLMLYVTEVRSKFNCRVMHRPASILTKLLISTNGRRGQFIYGITFTDAFKVKNWSNAIWVSH